jgi:hypothetical protein
MTSGRLLARYPFAAEPRDPAVLAAAAASRRWQSWAFIPAQGPAPVDPAVALRAE